MSRVKLRFRPYTLYLRHPFRLAYGTRSWTALVLVELEMEGKVGYGEASLPPYLKEDVNSVTEFMKRIEPVHLDPYDLQNSLRYVDKVAAGNTAAKAAIDIALHDLSGKLRQKPLSILLGIQEASPLRSTYTLGMSFKREMKIKLAEAKDYAFIKLKLGGNDDKALVETYLSLSDRPFCVDVNQGWKDKFAALEMVTWLAENNVLFVEQPLPVNMKDETAWLTERCPVPVFADESVQRSSDLKPLTGVFKGVNIKLMKCGGIAEGLKMVEQARALGFKVLVGCMAESSCAVTAAANLAPLADWADMDGPALCSNDPFKGILMRDGRVVMPEGPGLGLEKLC